MRNKIIFKQAMRILFDSGKLLVAVLGFCVFLLSAVLPLIIADAAYLAFSYTPLSDDILLIALYILLAVLILLITMPVFYGYLEMLYSILLDQRDVYVADIFDVFKDSHKYFHSIFYGIRYILRAIFTFGLALFFALYTCYFAKEVFGENYVFIIKFFTVLFSVLEFIFFYLLFSFARARGFLGVYYLVRGNDKPYKQSKKVLRTKMFSAFCLKLAFIGISFLSLLTIGSLFIVTMPIMAIAYFIYGNQITENIND